MAWTSNYYQPWPTTKYDQSDKPHRVEGHKPGSETLTKQSPYQHLSGTSVYAVATPCTPESYINTHKSKSKKNKKRQHRNGTDSVSKHKGVYSNGISNGYVNDDASDVSEAERKRQKKERRAKITMVVIILLVIIGVIICVIAVYYTVNPSGNSEVPDSPSASGLHSPPPLVQYNVSFVMDAIEYHSYLQNKSSRKYEDLSQAICSVFYFIFSEYSQMQEAYQNCAILNFREESSSVVPGPVVVDVALTFRQHKLEEQLLKNSNQFSTGIFHDYIVEALSKSDEEIVINFVKKYDPNLDTIYVVKIRNPNE